MKVLSILKWVVMYCWELYSNFLIIFQVFKMRYNFGDEFFSSEEFSRQSHSRQIVEIIRDVALDLMHSLQVGTHQFDSLAHYTKLSNELDSLWLKACNGIIKVNSIAILRAIHKVFCKDIGTSLGQPFASHRKLQAEISLLVTTIDQLLLPNTILARR
ncbi:MAG: hypothetical protein P1Q69_14450 [Candidatus Thorarchaeota archaeon]|nr:hypothetical protein [Candidatus Thorarchaeota archaeon]